MTRRTYEADANHTETADDLLPDNREGLRASLARLYLNSPNKRGVWQINFYRWITLMKIEKENLLVDPIKNPKSQEDKFAAARVIKNKDGQKTANAM